MLPLLFLFLAAPPASDLAAEFAEIAHAAQGKVGASVMLLETGESL